MSKPAKIPVLKTTLEVYAVTARHIGDFIKISWLWLIVLLVVSAAIYWAFYPAERAAIAAGSTGTDALYYATLALSTVIGAAIAVPWHRLLIAGEAPRGRGLWFDKRMVLYVLTVAALGLFFIISTSAVGLITASGTGSENSVISVVSDIAFAVGVWAVALAANRLTLVLPATALDRHDISFQIMWSATRGNSLRLVGIFLLVVLPLIVPPLLYASLSGADVAAAATQSRLPFALWGAAVELTAMAVGIVEVTFLSLAYRHFFSPELGGGAEPGSP